MMTWRWFACVALSMAAGCAPTVLSTRTDLEVLRSEKVIGGGHDRTIKALLREHDDGATLVLTSQETCDEQAVRVVRRREITERKADVGSQVGLYLLAAAAGGLGAAFVIDAPNVPEPGDPMTRNPVGRTGAYALGGVTLGAGAVFLGLGIGTTVRGRDLSNDLGEATEHDGEPRAIVCNQRPVANQPLSLTIVGTRERKQLGTTDAEGRIEVRWASIRPLLLDGVSSADGTVAIGDGTDGATVDLTAGRRYFAPRILEEARALIAEDKVDDATARLKLAESLGADVSSATRQLAAAPTSIQRQRDAQARAAAAEARVAEEATARAKEAKEHVALAWKLARQDKLNDADEERQKAVALGVDDEKLVAELRQRADKRALGVWKTYAGRCAQLQRDQAAIDRVQRCDSACERIRAKVQAAWELLSEAPVPPWPDSEAAIAQARELCSRSGCPNCP